MDLQMITYHDELLQAIKLREAKEDACHQLNQLLGKKYKFTPYDNHNNIKLYVRKRGLISFIKFILPLDNNSIYFDKQDMKIHVNYIHIRDKFAEELANDLDKYFPEYEILVR
jgi:hypothetical protein